MTLNKTKIEWCDRTWNPVTGCLHNCSYCYARKIAERFRGTKAWPEGFKPTIHNERSTDPLKEKKPQSIFVCSMADLFGGWVPTSWIESVMASCDVAPWHTYIFLTKNPQRYHQLPASFFKGDKWFGTTVSRQEDYHRVMAIQSLPGWIKTFISFEPLLEELDLSLDGIDGIILGAQTNPSTEVTPEMVQPIGQAAFEAGNIPMFCKDSMPIWARRKELPWRLNK